MLEIIQCKRYSLVVFKPQIGTLSAESNVPLLVWLQTYPNVQNMIRKRDAQDAKRNKPAMKDRIC